MSRKKLNLKFAYDAPVTLTYSILAVIIFVLYITVFKDKMETSIFMSPTNAKGALAFSFKDPLSYFRLFFHILGFTDKTVLLSDLIFVLLLGPQMEERYGSVIIGIMIFVSALFSGVLTACFCTNSTYGAGSPVFMLIILYALMFFSKKTVSATSIAVILLFVFRSFVQTNPNGYAGILITIAGGLCGSLFAFLASPKQSKKKRSEVVVSSKSFGKKDKNKKDKVKKQKEAKKTKTIASSKDVTVVQNDSSNDETVIGTIKF